MEKDTVVAVDIAKSVFDAAVSHEPGRVAQRRRLSRKVFLLFFAQMPAATVVMEACGSAHFWARKLQELGHRVVLLSPHQVRPYVVRNKTDRTDAKGILEAYRNADIRPVPVKSVPQQVLVTLHRFRSGWLAARTAHINSTPCARCTQLDHRRRTKRTRARVEEGRPQVKLGLVRRLVPALALALVLPACGGSPASPSVTVSGTCSTLGQVSFVRDTLQEWYFWYDQLPNPDPAGFSSPEAYLEAVRYRPLDTSFSYIANMAESDAFFSESQFIGIGVGTKQTSASELRVAQVFPGSPALDAGLERGDFLLTINDKAVSDLLRTGEIDTIFGPSQIGVVVTLRWRSLRSGDTRVASLAKRAVTIPTVSVTKVFDVRRGPRVGYVFFRNFVSPSVAALSAAFRELKEAGVDELVLDLRYNGGGLLSVAQHLGGLIGGEATRGEVFAELFHNDKNQSRNSALRFELPADAIGFSRLVAITTRGSASASEGVINGLKPFVAVTLVGETTFGKPVGQYGFDFCESTLFPVAFETRNARGDGSFYGGIPADCGAGDDLEHALGNPREASLAEALEYLRTGACTAAASVAAKAYAAREARIGRGQPRDGWKQLVGAY